MTKEEIKEIRKGLGLSQAAFAKRIGLSPWNVSVNRWEKGKAHPSRLAEKAIRELVIRVDQEKELTPKDYSVAIEIDPESFASKYEAGLVKKVRERAQTG